MRFVAESGFGEFIDKLRKEFLRIPNLSDSSKTDHLEHSVPPDVCSFIRLNKYQLGSFDGIVAALLNQESVLRDSGATGGVLPSLCSQSRQLNAVVVKDTVTCEHCGRTGHTKERCYELIGFPKFKHSKRSSRK